MPTFNIHLGFDHGYSETEIDAESLQDALEKAKTITADEANFIEHYECGEEVEYIRVLDEEGDELEWNQPDSACDNAAVDLLEAAEDLVAYLHGHADGTNDSEPLPAVERLRNAVAMAKGQYASWSGKARALPLV